MPPPCKRGGAGKPFNDLKAFWNRPIRPYRIGLFFNVQHRASFSLKRCCYSGAQNVLEQKKTERHTQKTNTACFTPDGETSGRNVLPEPARRRGWREEAGPPLSLRFKPPKRWGE